MKNKVLFAGTAVALTGGLVLYHQRQTVGQAVWKWRVNSTVFQVPRRIVVVETIEQWNSVEKEMLRCCDSLGAVGFDCEWVTAPKLRRPVALLQLATHTGLCVLVRLCTLQPVPGNLIKILNDERILKVGVGPEEDCKLLWTDHGIIVDGVLDLKKLINTATECFKVQTSNKNKNKHKNKAKLKPQKDSSLTKDDNNCEVSNKDVNVTNNNGTAGTKKPQAQRTARTNMNDAQMNSNSSQKPKLRLSSAPKSLGLNALSSHFMNRTLDKDWRVRASDWEAHKLSIRQLNYAAEDARAGLHVLLMFLLDTGAYSFYSTSTYGLSPLYSWVAVTKRLIEAAVSDIVSYAPPGGWTNATCKSQDILKNSSCNAPGSSTSNSKSYRRAYSLRKTPLYHNSVLWAPDDEPLCVVDPKKAHWYVDNNLGEVVQEDPFIVRLKFEPTGRPQKEGSDGYFYLNERQNVCVVCGKDESYIRKNIIPHEYRKHFPEILKSHQNHDVVLLCTVCHQVSNQRDSILRYKLAEEHDAPIGNSSDVKVVVDGNLKHIKSAGKALLTKSHRIPPERIEELQQLLREYFEVNDLTDELLTKAATLDVSIVNDSYEPHGLRVYKYYEKIGVIRFEKLWRENFLNTMEPKFMPTGWSITHNHEKLKLKMSRCPLDDPVREQYKIALVGIQGDIDVPYVPQNNKRGKTVSPSSSSIDESSRSSTPTPSNDDAVLNQN